MSHSSDYEEVRYESRGDDEPLMDAMHEKSTANASLQERFRAYTIDWAPIDPLEHSFNLSIQGLRGIAVCLTMLCHIISTPVLFREVAGSMGVTIFFVLSGFLITAVLIRLEVSAQRIWSFLSIFTDAVFPVKESD